MFILSIVYYSLSCLTLCLYAVNPTRANIFIYFGHCYKCALRSWFCWINWLVNPQSIFTLWNYFLPFKNKSSNLAPDPVFPPSLSIAFPPSLSNTHTDTQTQTDTYTHPWYTPPLNLEFSPSIRLGPVSSYSFPWSLPLTQPFTLNSTFSELLKHLMFIPQFCTYVFLIFVSTSFPSGSRKCTVIRTWGV